MKPSERAVWHEAVRAIESYRERWGVRDQEHPLGEGADATEQEVEREMVARRLENLTEKAYEAEIHVRERSIEL